MCSSRGLASSFTERTTSAAITDAPLSSANRPALRTTNGNPRKAAAVSFGSVEATRAISAARRDESRGDKVAIESIGIDIACPATKPTVQAGGTPPLPCSNDRTRAVGQAVQSPLSVPAVASASVAWPAGPLRLNRSIRARLTAAGSSADTAPSVLSLKWGNTTAASLGLLPATISAGPALESFQASAGMPGGLPGTVLDDADAALLFPAVVEL